MLPKRWPWFGSLPRVERSPDLPDSKEWNRKIAVIGDGISGLLAIAREASSRLAAVAPMC